MFSKKHVSEVLEKFYLCTNLPIQAFRFDGLLIGSSGYTHRLNSLFNNYDIFERINLELSEDKKKSMITISCLNNVCFTACYICPKNIHSGLYILGPHSCNKDNDMNIVYKPKCLMSHLISLLRSLGKDYPHNQAQATDGRVYSLHVKKAIDYINFRYNEEVTLIDITDYLEINKCYFCSIFKKETGKTFTQFLNETRIENSKRLLLEGNSSLLDIALAVGFNNQNYYNIIFKKATNKTPLEFRKFAK